MPKHSKSKTDKKKRSIENGYWNLFCIPEPKRKSSNKRNAVTSSKKTSERTTQTVEVEKCNIATVVNIYMDNMKPGQIPYDDLKNFPLCQDLKGIYFFNDQLTRKCNCESLSVSLEKNKLNKINVQSSPTNQLKRISYKPVITLKDVLDENDSVLEYKPLRSVKLNSKILKINSNIFDDSKKNESNLYFNRNVDYSWEITNKDSLTELERKTNTTEQQTYEYVETTKLLPIGEGVTNLNPFKTRLVYQNSTSANNFTLNNNLEQLKVTEINSPIEIPPEMPPLLISKRNNYVRPSQSTYSRSKAISEKPRSHYYISIDKKQFRDKDDHHDVDIPLVIKPKTMETNKKFPQRIPFTNNVLQRLHLNQLDSHRNSLKDHHRIINSFHNYKLEHNNIRPTVYSGVYKKDFCQMSTNF